MTYRRECNGCTACCEGWLPTKVDGHVLQPGRPCHFKCENGCSVYEDRPEDPCRTYVCEWLRNPEIPEWMKPNLCGVIITERDWGGRKYLTITEAGKKIDSRVLNWLFLYHYTTNIPIRFQVDGGWYNYGNEEFLNYNLECGENLR